MSIPKVILLIESSTAYGRGLLRGIARYVNLNGPWQIYREPPFYMDFKGSQKKKLHLLQWGANGMILREPHRHKYIIDMNIPTIISPNKVPGLPAIITDYKAIGNLAAEHFLERGFQNFAFCGYDDMPWSRNRAKGFGDRLGKAGYLPDIYKQPKSKKLRSWENEQPYMIEWLKRLPKPVGIMACNDDRGQNIIETSKLMGLLVPEEVAVIGVDNDELVCNLTNPTLTSIALNPEKDGYEAAKLLDRLMAGEKPDNLVIVDSPTHIITRQSTDSLAIADKDVAMALRYIKQNCRKNIQVDDIADHVALSRRTLARKFQLNLQSSVHQQIKRFRIEEITRMLIETNYSISQIAQKLDFPGIEHIARYFCKEKGMTPLEYRKRHKHN